MKKMNVRPMLPVAETLQFLMTYLTSDDKMHRFSTKTEVSIIYTSNKNCTESVGIL